MSKHIVKVLKANYITHDVKHFELEKPSGFTFIPGQAADVSINIKGWEGNLHPFTFTGLNEWDYLEFMIKIYPERNGVTNMLGKINAGDELILHDVFGAIQYKGKGVFIAGGAGITPFVAIFRNLYKTRELVGNKLIYSNKTSADVILEKELEQMLHTDFIKTFTREHSMGFIGKRIDRNFLIDNIADFSQHFYICGPDEFVKDITAYLKELGASPDTLVIEQ